MRTLRVLGGLWLDDADGRSSGRGAQRRRLALLTLVALSPGRRITRDKALAVLWPENTSAEGRRRLSSAVYDLRGMLGDHALESLGDELFIGSAAELQIDVEQFEGALARGEVEGALAAYGGPLLDGVHLTGAAEFEEWIALQRERLARLHLQAIEHAASARLARGDASGAVSAALQLLDLEPLSARAALTAVNTVATTGDRPRALGIAEAHASRVRRELGIEPDTAVLDAMQRLRATPAAASANTGGTIASPLSPLSPIERPSDAPLAVDSATPARIDVPPHRSRVSWLRRGAVAATLVIATFAGVAFRSRASATRRESFGEVDGSGFTAAAARSTRSSAALEAFTNGESAYEHGRYDAAVKFFQSAIAHDSTFALAHLRLSESLLWQEMPAELAIVHDSLALKWSSNLSDDERLLVRAYVAWRHGEYELADSLDQAVGRRDPGNAEAHFQLGEVLFHYNPLRGRSIGEALPWFENAEKLDSANWGARWHLLLLDASRVGQREFRDEVARLLAARPDGQLAAELLLFAAEPPELPRLAATATGSMLFDAAWRRAVFRRDLAGAESLLVRMEDRKRPEFERTAGSYGTASLRFARGRVAAAVPLLDTRSATGVSGADSWVLLVHGLMANHADSAVNVDSLARAIDRWRQTLNAFDQPTGAPAVVSRYLGGLLAVMRGDTSQALRLAASLDQIVRQRDPFLPLDSRDPRELAQTIRAYAHYRTGRCEDVLRDLDAEHGAYWLGVVASSALASQSLERYLRAQCLLALGRNQDAIAWFETFEQGTLYDLEFLGASLRGQATAHRALGELDAATAIERRLAELESP